MTSSPKRLWRRNSPVSRCRRAVVPQLNSWNRCRCSHAGGPGPQQGGGNAHKKQSQHHTRHFPTAVRTVGWA